MPSSLKSRFAIAMLIYLVGSATAYGDHDHYIQKLDGFSKSQDPELVNGVVANEVFSYEIGNSFTNIMPPLICFVFQMEYFLTKVTGS